jgi:hypothetical protein
MADGERRDRRRKALWGGLGWCICIVLWTLGLLTTAPMRAGEALTPTALHFPAAKTLHVCVYAFLLIYAAWLPVGRWSWLFLVFLSLHAGGTEYLQQYVPGRHGTLRDVLIDHIGLLLGLALTWKRWIPRSNSIFV